MVDKTGIFYRLFISSYSSTMHIHVIYDIN